jgi:hypothetical protein
MTVQNIMVLGVSRGGTTLLAAALGAHSRVAMLDEDFSGAFAKVTGGKIGGVKLCVPNQVELTRRWRPVYALATWNGVLRKSHLMNRVPRCPLSIRDHQALAALTPVCVLRDPRAVVAAIMGRENRRRKVAVYRWRRCLEIFQELERDRETPPVFVDFDRLVTEPEATLKALAVALNLDYERAMLQAPARNERYASGDFDSSKAGPGAGAGLDLSELPQAVWDAYWRLKAASV